MQVAMAAQFEKEVMPQVEAMGIEKVVCCEEAWQMMSYYHKCDTFKQFPKLLEVQQNTPSMYQARTKIKVYEHFLDNHKNLGIFLCMSPKTGDHTMMHTLWKYSVPNIQMHTAMLLNKNLYSDHKIKIVTAIRDPIARDISGLYEACSKIGVHHLPDYYYKKINDVNVLFEYITNIDKKEKRLKLASPSLNFKKINLNSYSPWFTSFKENIINLLDHPFDQEKGYTIIKEGNYDIFFYQLEKLNDLVPELSEWVGTPFTELVNGNEAKDKWIAKSYKQAQKELKFSQEYFDLCYNDPYVQHCYSQEDIEKFKDRWRKNIDPNK